MSPDVSANPTKLCPTCGTRVSAEAVRCLVCGSDLSGVSQAVVVGGGKAKSPLPASRIPEITLSLPAAIGLLAIFLGIGAMLVYVAIGRAAASAPQSLPSPTPTWTETPTLTPTPEIPTPTWTPEPSPTPFEYIVKLGDTCGSIAYAFKVSIQSIVLLNNLPADCGVLYENQRLKIPHPTPTPSPPPTATLSPAEATEAACQKITYTVQENDTLSSIALNYNVPADAIREYNGLVNDIVRFGQPLIIPLCRRNATPGPSPTPTLPPPYPPVNLLLPPDGAPFSALDSVITLQWASVGSLLPNEAYAVTLEDLTGSEGRRLVSYVTDTKFIVPANFLPNDRVPHVIRWWVVTVRQVGTDNDGNPIWAPAGAVSVPRVFTWYSLGAVTTPNP